MAEVIGKPHAVFDEAIFAFVRLDKDTHLEAAAILDHCKTIAAYKRPLHVEIWPTDQEFPLTRSTKVDKLALSKLADPIIEELRANGKWDKG